MTDLVSQDHASDFITQIARIGTGNSVVWDFDGVVADTEPLQDATYRLLAERRGYTLSEGYFAEMVGRTEDEIWASLIRQGFPMRPDDAAQEVRDFKAERKHAFMELSRAELSPSWLARRLMPALHRVARQQVIVSNGDADVIELLMTDWDLLRFVEVGRRSAGTDKAGLLSRYCSPGSLLFEDNPGWLARGKSLGATTVGVVHGYNTVTALHADFLVEL